MSVYCSLQWREKLWKTKRFRNIKNKHTHASSNGLEFIKWKRMKMNDYIRQKLFYLRQIIIISYLVCNKWDRHPSISLYKYTNHFFNWDAHTCYTHLESSGVKKPIHTTPLNCQNVPTLHNCVLLLLLFFSLSKIRKPSKEKFIFTESHFKLWNWMLSHQGSNSTRKCSVTV